jgi:NAD-dependent dihydropyrimidine dehydrogenase PreA subunit
LTASPMKYLLLFYSGAGNTEYITTRIEKVLLEHGDTVTAKRITLNNIGSLDDDFDVLGIGYPSYFREAPGLVHDCLKAMNGRQRSVFFYCTKGMYSGNTSRSVIALSRERGFVPKGHIEFYMPGTDGLILFAKKGSTVERVLKAIHSKNIDFRIRRFMTDILDRPAAPLPKLKSYTTLDRLIVRSLESWIGDSHKIYIGQFRCLEDKCIDCQLCVTDCPRNNIEFIDPGVVFGENCDTCFRCIHHCPVEAIQIGDKTVNTVRYRPLEEM